MFFQNSIPMLYITLYLLSINPSISIFKKREIVNRCNKRSYSAVVGLGGESNTVT